MSAADVFVAVALLAALACPAHMLWRSRRGQRTCCAPETTETAELLRRQRELAHRVEIARADRLRSDAGVINDAA